MAKKLRPIPIERLLEHISREMEMSSTVFGVPPGYRAAPRTWQSPGGGMELPLGVALGPHGQMAQNLAAAYVAGARFFELPFMTATPCAARGCGHVQVSGGGLGAQEALEEYIKGSVVLQLMARELGLGSPEGFVFRVDLGPGTTLEALENLGFWDVMRDCSGTETWGRCTAAARGILRRFNNLEREDVEALRPQIGCWIGIEGVQKGWEKVAGKALEGGFSVSVRVPLTAMDPEWAIRTLEGSVPDLDETKFSGCLEDLLRGLPELEALAQSKGLSVDLAVTGSAPRTDGSWQGGAAVGPAALELAAELAERTGLSLSYSGGADAANIAALRRAGLRPITAATTLLKPGGYLRLRQMARNLAPACTDGAVRPDPAALRDMAAAWREEQGRALPPGSRKRLRGKSPLFDCFTAPCSGGCPLGEDVAGFLRLMSDGRYRDALRVILDRNPLPHITGAICPQPCGESCTRLFYDEPVDIRGTEALCAQSAWGELVARLEPAAPLVGQRVAVIGGGPAGMAAAFLLARRGVPVTLFEKESHLGGAVAQFIPDFRVSREAVELDAQLLGVMGADVRLNTPAPPAPTLLKSGYSHVFVAVGAAVPALLNVEGKPPMAALDFLAEYKKDPARMGGWKHIVVAGSSRTALDAARAAVRLPGVEGVWVVSPKPLWECAWQTGDVRLAREEGVRFLENAQPNTWDGETLRVTCAASWEEQTLPAQLVLAAMGETVDGALLTLHGAALTAGKPAVGEDLTGENPRIFYLGDCRLGPSSVPQAMADAHRAVEAILGAAAPAPRTAGRRGGAMGKKGKLRFKKDVESECERCLECQTVCECCVDVCPNRANVAISMFTRGKPQILHLDGLCGKCGVCGAVCPFESAPFEEKFTLFETEEDFARSENTGFVVLDFLSRRVRVRLEGKVWDTCLRHADPRLSGEVQELMETIFADYPYLLNTGARSGESQLRLPGC